MTTCGATDLFLSVMTDKESGKNILYKTSDVPAWPQVKRIIVICARGDVCAIRIGYL
jgi:hypothetical protein